MKLRHALLAAPLLCFASPAAADLPDAAKAMIEAAIATGDADTVEAVVGAARTAFPDDLEAIEEIWHEFREEQQVLAAAQAQAEEQEIRQASLFDRWSGQGQIGGFQSSGNSDEFGITAALQLEREGIDWEHRLRVSADYREQDGERSREQFLARYEPRYEINDSLFAFGLAQWDRNIRQGFTARYAVSGGLGYRVIDNDNLEFSIKAGPAYRITNRTDGTTNSRIAGLVGLDFDWDVTDSLKLTQDTNATAETGGEVLLITDGSNTSITATTGLEAGITDALSARLAWTLEYDSNPPAGSLDTDTLTRFTLVYGF